MVVETYRKQVEARAEIDPDRDALLDKLGLEAQKEYRTDLSADALFKTLEGFERAVFELAFPIGYSRCYGHFENYRFDRIPTRALEAIGDAATLGVFSDIQIWTPGAQSSDPVAVGILGRPAIFENPGRWHWANSSCRMFLIARWGADELYTLRQLAEYVFCGVALNRMPDPTPPSRYAFINLGRSSRCASCQEKKFWQRDSHMREITYCRRCGI